MSSEGAKPAPAAGDAAGSSKPQQNGQPATPAAAGPGSEASGEKKLSGAEMKKKQKEEKAARRAQAKAAQTAAAPPGAAAAAAAAAAAKGKANKGGDAAGAAFNRGGNKIPTKVVPQTPKATVPECFSHLQMAKRMTITDADKDVHPAMLRLGQRMSTFAISDSITRAEATLLAFKGVCQVFSPAKRQP